jgi:hypothetical protein
VRYGFIEAHRGRWPVRLMCRVPGVAAGGYYGWRGRPLSPRAQRRETLVVAIKAIHGAIKARYGSPRVPRRAGRPGRALLREYRGPADAPGGDRRQDEAEVPRHD